MRINVGNDFVVTKFVVLYLIMKFDFNVLLSKCNVFLFKILIAYACIGFIKCACLMSESDNDYLGCISRRLFE